MDQQVANGFAALTAREQQVWDDFEWVLHDPSVQREYAGRFVVVNRRTIWGAGKDLASALDAASRTPECPPRDELAKVFVEGTPLLDYPEGPIP